MAKLPIPTTTEDIYSYGFDRTLNREIIESSSSIVYNSVKDAIQAQTIQFGASIAGSQNSLIVNDPTKGFWIGHAKFDSAPFAVNLNGDVKANSIELPTDIKTFTANGTWTKPAGSPKKVFVELWGGGGSGGSRNSATGTRTAGGGGGGAYVEGYFDPANLGATETVTVGVGGAAVTGNNAGNVGGNSVFDLLTAYGGGPGSTADGATANGGGGGGQMSAGTATAAGNPGSPIAGAQNGGIGLVSSGGGDSGEVGADTFSGGAGGGGSESGAGGRAGGTSIYGGNGGAGSNVANGTAGSQPAGGGGATTLATGTSGAGGDGKIIVTTFF